MAYLYGASAGYGVMTGIWIDSLAMKDKFEPATALIAPILLGAAVPVGMFIWDYYGTIHRGVPSTMATGIILGALEGFGVAGAVSAASTYESEWGFGGYMTSMFIGATAGGVGGYVFGEALRPNPKALGFISGGVAWGAMAGAFIGGGATDPKPKDPRRGPGDTLGAGAAIGALVGGNVGLLGTGSLAAFGFVPSLKSQKWMWIGGGIGVVATSPIYLFYVGKDDPSDIRRGMIANGLGLVAGVTLGAILTSGLKDDDDVKDPNAPPKAAWKPPFMLSGAPLQGGGGMLQASGEW
jgi:hypothetical protein